MSAVALAIRRIRRRLNAYLLEHRERNRMAAELSSYTDRELGLSRRVAANRFADAERAREVLRCTVVTVIKTAEAVRAAA